MADSPELPDLPPLEGIGDEAEEAVKIIEQSAAGRLAGIPRPRGRPKGSSTKKDKEPKFDDAPTTPPRRERSTGSGSKVSLTSNLQGMFTVIGITWGRTVRARDPENPGMNGGETLQQQSHELAVALNEVAQKDNAVYRFLSGLTTGGGWGSVAFAAFPIFSATRNDFARLRMLREGVQPIGLDEGLMEEAPDEGNIGVFS